MIKIRPLIFMLVNLVITSSEKIFIVPFNIFLRSVQHIVRGILDCDSGCRGFKCLTY